jgi:hypothetical protein
VEESGQKVKSGLKKNSLISGSESLLLEQAESEQQTRDLELSDRKILI